jgi:hypothetical protein
MTTHDSWSATCSPWSAEPAPYFEPYAYVAGSQPALACGTASIFTAGAIAISDKHAEVSGVPAHVVQYPSAALSLII